MKYYRTKNMKLRTKLWKRSKQSWATTVPQSILLLANVNVDVPINVLWDIDIKTRKFTVQFTEDVKE